jgi:hypothetical protein
MELFDFEVLQGEEVIAVERSVPLNSRRAAWPKIIELAKGIELPRCRIRVKEQAGETIILVGATAALQYADFDFERTADRKQGRSTLETVYRVWGANLGAAAYLLADSEQEAVEVVAGVFKLEKAALKATPDETVGLPPSVIILESSEKAIDFVPKS